jgi:hypothetical protein
MKICDSPFFFSKKLANEETETQTHRERHRERDREAKGRFCYLFHQQLELHHTSFLL